MNIHPELSGLINQLWQTGSHLHKLHLGSDGFVGFRTLDEGSVVFGQVSTSKIPAFHACQPHVQTDSARRPRLSVHSGGRRALPRDSKPEYEQVSINMKASDF